MQRSFLKIGDRVKIDVTHSECAMHMGIAGKDRVIEIINGSSDRIYPMAQLISEAGLGGRGPVLALGEVGIYNNSDGMYAYDVEVIS